MTTLTPTMLATMPRVNLLPPEIAAAARLRRLKVFLVAALVGVTALVVLGFLLVSGQVGVAEDDLATAQAQGTQLQSDLAEYAEVPEVLAQVQTAQTNLATAAAPEIRWSFYLNDLSLTIPSTTRLTNMTAVNQAAAAQVAAPTTETLPPVTPLGEESVGSVTFQGRSTDFDAVAAWLQSLARQEGYVEPSVQNVAKAEDSSTVGEYFNVDSSTQLGLEALSGRFTTIANGE